MSEERETFRDASADMQEELEKMRLERRRKERSKQFDAKLLELANKAVDFRLKYGEENYLTELMTTFLDVALQLKEVIEVLSAVNVAMECLSDAIGFIDAAINFDQNLFEESLQQKYGAFARWRRRRKARKAIRNNVGRVKAIVDGLLVKYEMAVEIMDSLKTACGKMQKCMKKNSLTEKKSKAAMGEKFGTPSAAAQMIADIMKERGIEGAPSSSVSPEKDGGVSGIDDIL